MGLLDAFFGKGAPTAGAPAASNGIGDAVGGIDPSLARMMKFATIGNIGTQMMRLAAPMTQEQRAKAWQDADFSGGFQDNLMNALELQTLGERRQRVKRDDDRMEKARQSIAGMIQKTPPGRLRDAAMYFFESNDLSKAGELLFNQADKYDPRTGETVRVNALGDPVGGAPGVGGGPLPIAAGGSVGGYPAPRAPQSGSGPAPMPAPVPGGSMPPPPPGGGQVDQLTNHWRIRMQDPNLTPDEVRLITAQGSWEKAMDAYKSIKADRQSQANAEATQSQTALTGNRNAAEQLTSKFAEQTKSYDTVIANGQRAAQVASDGNMAPSAKLATLYQFMKTLDPDGAVREGDVEMAQSIQGFLERYGQMAENAIAGGGNISDNVIRDMAREMARLANDAAGRKERKRIQMIRRAEGRQVPLDMVTEADPNGSQNMPLPIGYEDDGTGIAQRGSGGQTAPGRADRPPAVRRWNPETQEFE
jgi:hypothetical protein